MQLLLIAPDFYDYHTRIIRELESAGWEVTFFAERPARWLYSPAKNAPTAVRDAVFSAYMRKILSAAQSTRFDRVLVIRGEILTPDFMQRLRASQPTARFTLYQWDSARVVDFPKLLPFFDAFATFDPEDAATLRAPYLPLFYVPEYRLERSSTPPAYDLIFVGSFHGARYKTMKEVQRYCGQHGLRFAHYLFLSWVDYVKLILRGKAPPRTDVRFKKLSLQDILRLYQNTSSILDIENFKQAGLTMRTFEALATGRNLVTTNGRAPGLLPSLASRIVVLDRDTVELPHERLSTCPGQGQELDPFSLAAWTKNLLAL